MRILGERLHIRDNLRFSFKRYTIWWIILLVTMVFDYLSTTVFVARYGTAYEANLVTRLMMDLFSPNHGNVLGKALQLLAVVCFVGISRKIGNFFIVFVILINCWAVVMNSIS